MSGVHPAGTVKGIPAQFWFWYLLWPARRGRNPALCTTPPLLPYMYGKSGLRLDSGVGLKVSRGNERHNGLLRLFLECEAHSECDVPKLNKKDTSSAVQGRGPPGHERRQKVLSVLVGSTVHHHPLFLPLSPSLLISLSPHLFISSFSLVPPLFSPTCWTTVDYLVGVPGKY